MLRTKVWRITALLLILVLALAAGATIPSSFLNMMPYIFTIVVLVIITAYEHIGKRLGAPAALGLPFACDEKG